MPAFLGAFRARIAPALAAALVARGNVAVAQSEPPLPPTAPATAAPATNPASGAPATANPAVAPPPTVNPPIADAQECFPPCREGYVCHQRQCVSLCNPPCPSGQVCVSGMRCDIAPMSPGSTREPPLPPPVKPFADQGFMMLGFHYGFPGTLEFDPANNGYARNTLDPTIGFNLRGDVPIERYLVLGPFFQFGSWRPESSGASSTTTPSRSYYVDADLYVRGRIPIPSRPTNFQIWLGVPVGLTVDILGENTATTSGGGYGWNIGVLGGGAVHFTRNVGVFAELGWLQHKVTHDGEPTVYVRLSQWTLNLGFVFKE